MLLPTVDDVIRFLADSPHVVVPIGVVVGEFLVLLAARRGRTALDHVLGVTEITSFAAASTVLAAGALPGTFLTSRLPALPGTAALVAYLLVVPFVWLSTQINRHQPATTLQARPREALAHLFHTLEGGSLLVGSAIYLWASLFLAAVYR